MEISYDDSAKAIATLNRLTDEGQMHDLKAAFEFLKNDPEVDASQIACVGYCMGGRSTFLASTFLPLKAAICYYGGRIPSLLSRVEGITAPLMLLWGSKDKHIGSDQHNEIKNALTKAGKSFIHVEFSDADHAFFCEERKSYHQKSAEISWDMTMSFLQKNLNFGH
jgi:carboxymethylenebutenolidase